MKAIVITPPLMQLNSPYPSGAYLKSFFESENISSVWYDLSIRLFYSIFSKKGLEKLFELTEKKALELAVHAEKSGEDEKAFNIRRYISTKSNWIEWIEFITGILCNSSHILSGREKEHQFLYSPFAPRGNRMENYLSNLDHTPTVDDVRFLCTLSLADLSDYITVVFDNEFSLIRYAERLTVDESSFSEIEKRLDSPVLKHFYEPVLDDLLKKERFLADSNEKKLFCISVPFAGTFLAALYTARFLKNHFGNSAFICIGGGFINTELREANDAALSKYIDAVSYDRGYGSYKSLLNANFIELSDFSGVTTQLYKMRLFFKDGKILSPVWDNNELEQFENQKTVSVMPDFSDIDFSVYPRVCDDLNPMHRMWSDGAWIKAYIAHGCYWHKCAFCDTKLDYVCSYKPVSVAKLFDCLYKTAEQKGVYGIHFVDEALPPRMLKDFALLNAKNGNKLYFWGNVRFEKSFSKDLAAFLSYAGLGSVSAGLEVATGEGLENINKGTNIDSIVSACAAFKEAGILVHAYMIYGFWNDTPQSIINSLETLRQFFASGLLDSAFYHKFVLTRNSTIYNDSKNKEWIEQNVKKEMKSSIFAKNCVHFNGEEKYDKYGPGLEAALSSWMHGNGLDKKVQKWFDFPVPAPTVQKDYIEKIIEKYEKKSSQRDIYAFDSFYWLGSQPVSSRNELLWIYLQCEYGCECDRRLGNILWSLRPSCSDEERKNTISLIKGDETVKKELRKFFDKGLVVI